jgi:two-component sensor histidine kinase
MMAMTEHSTDQMAAMRLRAMSAGLQQHNFSVLRQNLDLTYNLAENLPGAWPAQSPVGKTDAETLSEEIATTLQTAKTKVLATGKPETVEVEIRTSDLRHIFEVQINADLDDESGEIIGLVTVLSDVSDMRERDLAVANLLREVSHRSKNLLAIVQSVAMQTAHHSDGINDFLIKFRGRLHALSSAQDLVTESNWRGTTFRALVNAQFARLGQTSIDALTITGDNPILGPNASLHIGLALHELATNSILHGALYGTDHDGAITISAHVTRTDYQPEKLIINWLERGFNRHTTVTAPRFGTLVLQRIVPLSVGGEAKFHVGADKVTYNLEVPAGQFES